MRIIVFVVFLIFFAAGTDGICTLPTELRGDWISADKGVITFSTNEITNYPIALSAVVTTMDFGCETLSDGLYYLRGTSTFTVFSNDHRAHICLEFHKISPDKYYYHVATTMEATIDDRIFVRKDSIAVTHGDVCNRQKPFEIGSYVMLVRNGKSYSSLAIRCPSDTLNIFDQVNIKSSDDSRTCSGSRLDTCTDETTTNFTYSSCNNSLTYTDGGEFRCIYYISSGEVTYLALLNMDNTTTASQTFRMVCYAIDWHRDSLKATAYPGSCRVNQTATYVESPGVIMTMTDISVDCETRSYSRNKNRTDMDHDTYPEHGFDMVPYYVGAIALALLVIGCAGVCFSYYHYKKADKTNRVRNIRVKGQKTESMNRETSSGIFSYSSFDDDEYRNVSTSTPKPPLNFQHRFMPVGAVMARENRTLKPHQNTKQRSIAAGAVMAKESKATKQRHDSKHLSKAVGTNKAKDRRPAKIRPKLTSPPTTLNNILLSNGTQNSGKNVNPISIYDEIHNTYAGKDSLKRSNVETAEDFYRNQEKYSGFTNLKQKQTKRKHNINDINTNSVDEDLFSQDVQYFNPTNDGFIKFSERHDIYTNVDSYKPKKNKPVQEDGPAARGRGNVTNTVHYFDRRIPMHWK